MDTPNTTPSQAIPPLRLGTLFTVFRDSYASHLLIPSLLVFLLVKLASRSEVAVICVFLLASALLVSAAHRALTDANIFAELSFRRMFFRAVVIVALVGVLVSLAMVVVAPILFFAFLIVSAFASGWNEAAKVLPQTDWAETLIQEFTDSPYGPPRLPERRSFSPIPPVAQTG